MHTLIKNFVKFRTIPAYQNLYLNKRSASFKDLFKRTNNDNVDFKNSPLDKENISEKQQDMIKEIKFKRAKAYKPTSDVESKIKSFAKDIFGDDIGNKLFNEILLTDPINKFNLLTKCIETFNHNIPNTSLNDIKTVDDLIGYYSIEQKDTSTLEDIKQMTVLPSNVHINLEYNRFDPATDKFFGGRDAYPMRDTIVTSLWYSKKYKSVLKKKEYFSE